MSAVEEKVAEVLAAHRFEGGRVCSCGEGGFLTPCQHCAHQAAEVVKALDADAAQAGLTENERIELGLLRRHAAAQSKQRLHPATGLAEAVRTLADKSCASGEDIWASELYALLDGECPMGCLNRRAENCMTHRPAPAGLMHYGGNLAGPDPYMPACGATDGQVFNRPDLTTCPECRALLGLPTPDALTVGFSVADAEELVQELGPDHWLSEELQHPYGAHPSPTDSERGQS